MRSNNFSDENCRFFGKSLIGGFKTGLFGLKSSEIMNMADGMAFGLFDPCRDYFTCIGDEYRETSCPSDESIIAGSTTEYQGLLLTLVKCQKNVDLDCDYSRGSTNNFNIQVIGICCISLKMC